MTFKKFHHAKSQKSTIQTLLNDFVILYQHIITIS